MGRRGFTRRDPWVTLVGHVDGGGGLRCVWGAGQRLCRKLLYVLLSFAVTLKLFGKIVFFERQCT